MAIVYFPKEGDKRCSACSYPVSDKGLAFIETIQKLDMLVNAGFIRKLEIKGFEMKNSTPVETDRTYAEWVEHFKNPVAAPKVENKKVEEVAAPKVEETVAAPVILTETPSQTENLQSQDGVTDAPVEDKTGEIVAPAKVEETVVLVESKAEVVAPAKIEEAVTTPAPKKPNKATAKKNKQQNSSETV